MPETSFNLSSRVSAASKCFGHSCPSHTQNLCFSFSGWEPRAFLELWLHRGFSSSTSCQALQQGEQSPGSPCLGLGRGGSCAPCGEHSQLLPGWVCCCSSWLWEQQGGEAPWEPQWGDESRPVPCWLHPCWASCCAWPWAQPCPCSCSCRPAGAPPGPGALTEPPPHCRSKLQHQPQLFPSSQQEGSRRHCCCFFFSLLDHVWQNPLEHTWLSGHPPVPPVVPEFPAQLRDFLLILPFLSRNCFLLLLFHTESLCLAGNNQMYQNHLLHLAQHLKTGKRKFKKKKLIFLKYRQKVIHKNCFQTAELATVLLTTLQNPNTWQGILQAGLCFSGRPSLGSRGCWNGQGWRDPRDHPTIPSQHPIPALPWPRLPRGSAELWMPNPSFPGWTLQGLQQPGPSFISPSAPPTSPLSPEPSLTSAAGPRLPGTSGSPGPELVAAASSRSPGLGHRAAAQGPCPLILPAWGSWAGSLSLGSARAAPSEQQQTRG